MKRIPLLIIFTIMLFSGCEYFTPNGVFSYDISFYLFSESSSDSTAVIYYPTTTSEFKDRNTNHNFVSKMNSFSLLDVTYNTNNNITKGWNPEEDFWSKIEFSPGHKVYALLESYSRKIEDENIRVISNKLFYEEVLTNEEKENFINYIKDQIELGNNWAAMSQSMTDTELLIGDY